MVWEMQAKTDREIAKAQQQQAQAALRTGQVPAAQENGRQHH